MGKGTKKVGSSGRWGPRYGVKSRMQVAAIEKKQRELHVCPRCGQKRVKRLGTGIWECRRCELIFAGGAYMPKAAKVIKAGEEMAAAAAKPKATAPGFMKGKKGLADAALAAAEPTKKAKKDKARKDLAEKVEAAKAEAAKVEGARPKKAKKKKEEK
jgi:large subunit ribosomal protein L37Ae